LAFGTYFDQVLDDTIPTSVKEIKIHQRYRQRIDDNIKSRVKISWF